MQFGNDGNLRVTSANRLLVVGTYSVHADEVRFTDRSGPMACSAKREETGVYRWKASGDTLVLSKIDDRCAGRLQDLTARPWKKK